MRVSSQHVRNDCMSRANDVWSDAITHFVEIRAALVELILPRGNELGMVRTTPTSTLETGSQTPNLKPSTLNSQL